MTADQKHTVRGRVRVERGHKRVRGLVHGRVVFDTTDTRLVWEVPYYPAYYVPITDVQADLVPNGATTHSPSRGDADHLDIQVGGTIVSDGALRYRDSPIEELRDLVRFEWTALDEWMEEDEPVYTHPRDPYTRVDILASSRHVRIEVDGVTVAESASPRVLFETGLPPRYYLPMSDVHMELLSPSTTVTHCPYKGAATYWSLTLGGRRYDDFVWIYRSPFAESQKIAGLLCFFNEKIDLYVDGTLQERPRTKFS